MELSIQCILIGITIVLCIIFHTPEIMCIILGICILLMLVANIYFHRRRENETGELIAYLMKVQDKLELPEMSRMREGQFGILQSEIYKLVVILQEQYSGERKQKRYLADMMSDISHQIKTPMTAITIMSDLLKTPDLPEEKRLEYVDKIDQQINRITWLVRNLLTLSQLEADMLPLKSEKILAEDIIDCIKESFMMLAEVKDIELSTHVETDIWLNCDKQWTTEAFSNIVKNCIEHTPEGGKVSIDVTQNNFFTKVIISDDGEGIAKEHLPYIFKRFYKAPGSSNNSVGIGLSMSKQIIMRQNGNIEVNSEVGKGTSFCIKMYRK